MALSMFDAEIRHGSIQKLVADPRIELSHLLSCETLRREIDPILRLRRDTIGRLVSRIKDLSEL